MDSYWFNKLLDVLTIQTNSENEKLMVLYLDKELKRLKLPYRIDAAGNILVIKGNAKTYPCVTSHMDTVHNFVDKFTIYKDADDEDVLFAMNGKQKTGIGGDDKCGVFGCLYLLKIIPQIKVVFFSREEIGCRGSTAINKKFFADCRYLIQLDRKNSCDFIQTYLGDKTVSHDFSSEIGTIKKKYGYKNCTGSVTDVMKLWKNKVGVSCINLSCGYYKPHTAYEYISISELWNSIKFTEEIISTMKPKKYTSLPPPPVVVKRPVNTCYNSDYSSNYGKCSKCGVWKKEALLYDFYDSKTNKMEKMCWPCKKSLISDKKQKTKQDSNIVPFACHECGLIPENMKKGDTLKQIGDHLYCNSCASLFDIPDKEPKICYMCDKPIPKDQTPIKDETLSNTTFGQWAYLCEECSTILGDDLDNTDEKPKQCYVCDKIIPKDNKVIERFGVRICEDCALPSDVIVG